MTLPKSLRPRDRYVFFEIETPPDASVDEGGVRRALWFEAQNLYGDVKSAETRAALVGYEPETETRGTGVVRCDHERVEETRSALACVHDVDGDSVGVRVMGVSGTLAAGRSRYLGDRETETREVRVDGRRAWLTDGALDVPDDDGFMYATPQDYVTDDT